MSLDCWIIGAYGFYGLIFGGGCVGSWRGAFARYTDVDIVMVSGICAWDIYNASTVATDAISKMMR